MPLPVFFTVYRTGEFTLAVGIQIEGTKKPPVGGFTTLLIALIILVFPMVPGAGLEPAQRERRGILKTKTTLKKTISYIKQRITNAEY
ncbi:hypothetical protein F8626_04625 [Salmonella enterica]|nr:hypothetical protein [Salmonella enterica]EEC0222480.1 hypothetical protein [Salmonella enterica]EHD2985399.1 hypothetical protein [Salmonella enterica]EHN5788439.1 hypothetical protein [Salmonella enterica]EJL9811078.1 hypothetical protein [Salmonella enterica]